MKWCNIYLLTSRTSLIHLEGRSCIIFSLSCYPHESDKANKMCLNETYKRVRLGKHLSGTIPIKNDLRQVDASSALLFNFALQYAIRRVRVNQDGLKVGGKFQLMVYADDVSIFGRNVHTIQKNTETLFVARKESGLEVNADETKYMIMSEGQNAGRSLNLKIDNSFERVE